MKKGYLLLLLGAIPAGLAILSAINPSNASETSVGNEHKDLETRIYKTDLKSFAAKVKEIIPTLTTYGQKWHLISANVYGNSATIKVEVPVVIFRDDLEITANAQEGKEGVSVDVRSKSRVGSSDLGENRRHIRQVLRAFDEKLAK